MEKVIKTRITKDGEPHETRLTISFDGVTPEQLEELAARSIIIATQSRYRIAGVVPATDNVSVADALKRERAAVKQTPESLAAKILKMTDEERATILRMLGDDVKPKKRKQVDEVQSA